MSDKQVILYDGSCGFCSSVAAFVAKRDSKKKFTFITLQSDVGRVLLRVAKLPESYKESLVYIRDGKPFVKSTAAMMVGRDMGGLWILLSGLMIVPKFIRDYVYDIIARSRHKLHRGDQACEVPRESRKADKVNL